MQGGDWLIGALSKIGNVAAKREVWMMVCEMDAKRSEKKIELTNVVHAWPHRTEHHFHTVSSNACLHAVPNTGRNGGKVELLPNVLLIERHTKPSPLG